MHNFLSTSRWYQCFSVLHSPTTADQDSPYSTESYSIMHTLSGPPVAVPGPSNHHGLRRAADLCHRHPNFFCVMGLVGGTRNNAMIFIFPPWFYLKLVPRAGCTPAAVAKMIAIMAVGTAGMVSALIGAADTCNVAKAHDLAPSKVWDPRTQIARWRPACAVNTASRQR